LVTYEFAEKLGAARLFAGTMSRCAAASACCFSNLFYHHVLSRGGAP
jgi:hypothetical protein